MQKIVLLVVFGMVCAIASFGQQDTVFTNLEHHLEYFDTERESYLPFVQNTGISTKTISLTIEKEYLDNDWLAINAQSGMSLFKHGSMVEYFGKDTLVFLPLARFSKGDRLVFYNNEGLQELAVQLAAATNDERHSVVLIDSKPSSTFTNLMVVFLLIVLAFYSYIKATGSEVTTGHFKWVRAVSLRTISEALYKTRMFEKGNLQVIIALSLLIGVALIASFYYSGFSSMIGYRFAFDGFLDGFFTWVVLSTGVFLGFVAKNILINGFNALYRFNSIKRVHFYNYIRMSSMIYTIYLILICVRVFVLPSESIVAFANILLLILLAVRALLLFLKLLNAGSYRILHLFSYICATELIPYVIMVKITFL